MSCPDFCALELVPVWLELLQWIVADQTPQLVLIVLSVSEPQTSAFCPTGSKLGLTDVQAELDRIASKSEPEALSPTAAAPPAENEESWGWGGAGQPSSAPPLPPHENTSPYFHFHLRLLPLLLYTLSATLPCTDDGSRSCMLDVSLDVVSGDEIWKDRGHWQRDLGSSISLD